MGLSPRGFRSTSEKGVACASGTIVDVLRTRAAQESHRQVFVFLADGERVDTSYTFGELDRRARSIAAYLQSHFGVDTCQEPVLLAFPPVVDFIPAFFGCLYAGVIAVPAYAPRRNRSDERISGILAHSDARLVLTTSGFVEAVESQFRDLSEMQRPLVVAVDMLPDSCDRWQQPMDLRNSLAFLQYTSGSTGRPKGVMVGHDNLVHNSEYIRSMFGSDRETVGCGWLPFYHDMGLVGCVVQPVYTGFVCYLMPPASFIQEPIRWLRAISRFSVTHSGGPNFAYDACVEAVRNSETDRLDLSSWKVAWTGAEPVRAMTLDRFHEKFQGSGFSYDAFLPTYGLAECTLMASAKRMGAKQGRRSPVRLTVSRDRMRQGQISTVAGDGPSIEYVSSGKTGCGMRVIVVDPQTRRAKGDDALGEVWIRGPSVTKGYWENQTETQSAFGASLNARAGAFLRTGDLGFTHQRELFVTGRLKELIIIRGMNVYPDDIERTVQGSHEALRAHSGAAFQLERNGLDRLAVVQEVERVHLRSLSTDAIFSAIRHAVRRDHALTVDTVVLVKPNQVPKTSSGKIARGKCRDDYLAGDVAIVAESSLALQDESDDRMPAQISDLQQPGALHEYLSHWMASRLGVPALEVFENRSFKELGMDSAGAIELSNELGERLSCWFSASLFGEHPTLDALCQHVGQTVFGLTNMVCNITTENERSEKTIARIDADAQFDPAIMPSWQGNGHRSGDTILLTGATGYLGGFLLKELLDMGYSVSCLVRASDSEEGQSRVLGNLRKMRIPTDGVIGRFGVVVGNLAQPRFGLSPAGYKDLAGHVTKIFHCAADVDFTAPYASLRASTVDGTREVVKFAFSAREKVLHHVSTAGIFCSDTYRKKDVVYETEVPASSRGIVFGYGQAKWGAEQIVRAAMARGLEAVIHRPGLIAGDTERGFWSERDLMTHLLRFELRNKSVAEYQRPFDGLPVDTMSRFLARCGTEGGFGGQTFHLVHPDPIAIETWLNAALGDTQVETRAFDVWHAELTQYFETEKGEVASFLPVFSHTIRGTNELLLDFFNHLPRFDFVRFRAAAEHCAVKIPDHKALAEGGWLESLT